MASFAIVSLESNKFKFRIFPSSVACTHSLSHKGWSKCQTQFCMETTSYIQINGCRLINGRETQENAHPNGNAHTHTHSSWTIVQCSTIPKPILWMKWNWLRNFHSQRTSYAVCSEEGAAFINWLYGNWISIQFIELMLCVIRSLHLVHSWWF